MTTLLRYAIYTRVSSDAGLERDFNSLDAQHSPPARTALHVPSA
jgi:hypothetical protein